MHGSNVGTQMYICRIYRKHASMHGSNVGTLQEASMHGSNVGTQMYVEYTGSINAW